MPFNNILKNPTLAGWRLVNTLIDKASNKRYIEYPNDWEQVSFPMEPDDPNKVPASFHRDYGFGLAAGFMIWRGGYVQRSIKLKAGQRYLAKVTFNVNMAFHEGSYPDNWQSHIEWFFLVNQNGKQTESPLMQTAQSQFGGDEEALFVFQPTQSMTADFGVMFNSRYPSTQGEILVKTIELLEVPNDFGSPTFIEPDKINTLVELNTPVETEPESDADVIYRGLMSAAQMDIFPNDVKLAFTKLAERIQKGNI